MLYGYELNVDMVEQFTQDYAKYQKMLIERINRLEQEHESLKVYINSGKKMQKIENEFK